MTNLRHCEEGGTNDELTALRTFEIKTIKKASVNVIANETQWNEAISPILKKDRFVPRDDVRVVLLLASR